MTDWAVFYDDGTVFTSDDGLPADAPPVGVIAVVSSDDWIGRSIVHRFDWYLWRSDLAQWLGCDTFGFHDQILNCHAAVGRVLQGRSTSKEVYGRVMDAARNDPRFPRKSSAGDFEHPTVSAGVVE